MKKTPPGRHAGRTVLLLLAAVLLLGLGLRVFHLLDASDSPFFNRPVIDGRAYDEWAMAIKEGSAPAEPFYQDPLYPHFLAILYAVFGHSFLAVYVVQLFLGLGVVLLAFDTGRLLFDCRAGIVAAACAALYGPFVFYEGMVEKTALGVFLVALLLWTAVRALSSRRTWWAAASGVVLGLACLVRANLLIFCLPLLLLYALGTRRLLRTGLAIAGILVVLAPVSIRNSVLAGEFVLTTTQGGQNFYTGNAPHNETGQYEAPPGIRPNPRFEQQDFRAQAEERTGREMGFNEVSRFWSGAALDWARDEPDGFLRLLGRKTVLYFNNLEVPDNHDISFFRRYSWVLRLPLLGFGALFALGFVGMVLFLRRSRMHLSFAVFFVGYAASVIAFFVLARYRLPGVVALLPFAGGIVFHVHDSVRRKRFGRVLLAAVLVLAFGAASFYPLQPKGRASQHAQSLVNLGSTLWADGDTAGSISALREALETRPGHPEATRNLGLMLLEARDPAGAVPLLAQVARANETDLNTRYHLGRAREMLGRNDSALTDYLAVLGRAPDEPKYRFAVGTALQKLGRYREALAHYDTLLSCHPDNTLALHNRAVALYNLGRFREALAELERVRSLGGPVNPNLARVVRDSLGLPD